MRIREPGKVCDGLWCLGHEESCVYLLEGMDQSMLISGGMRYILPAVLEQIKAMPQMENVPIHVMSGKEGKDEAISKGAIDFLQKPASKQQISEVFESFQSQDMKRLMIIEKKSSDSFQNWIGDIPDGVSQQVGIEDNRTDPHPRYDSQPGRGFKVQHAG